MSFGNYFLLVHLFSGVQQPCMGPSFSLRMYLAAPRGRIDFMDLFRGLLGPVSNRRQNRALRR